MVKNNGSEVAKQVVRRLDGLETGLRDVNVKLDMLEERLGRHEEKEENRYNKLMESLTWLVKMFKKFDEEQAILADKVIRHDVKISRLEKKVFGTSV